MRVDERSKLVLLVEDNASHAELVIDCLRQQQLIHRIVHVTNGEEALDYLNHRGEYADSTQHPRPDLVLLDLRMPKVDGFEVLKSVKTNDLLRSIPVVVLTTSDRETDIAKAYEYHANSYLVKPIQFNRLTRMLGDMGMYWLTWNRAARGTASQR